MTKILASLSPRLVHLDIGNTPLEAPAVTLPAMGSLTNLTFLRLSNYLLLSNADLDTLHKTAPLISTLWLDGCLLITDEYLFKKVRTTLFFFLSPSFFQVSNQSMQGSWTTKLKELVSSSPILTNLVNLAGDNAETKLFELLDEVQGLGFDMKAFVNAFIHMDYPTEPGDEEEVRKPIKIVRNALHRAARWNNVKVAEKLFELGVCPDSFSPDDKMTPLIIACSRGTFGLLPLSLEANKVHFSAHKEMANLLIQKKASVRICSIDGSNPLYCAAMSADTALTLQIMQYCQPEDFNIVCGDAKTTASYWPCQDGNVRELTFFFIKGLALIHLS